MKIKCLEEIIDYDGSQLRSHWIFQNFGILGNAVVAFRGKAVVPCENMVDLVDVQQNLPIFSHEMLHFIGEFFDRDLVSTVLLERCLVSLAQQEIAFRTKRSTIVRGGNDLYDGGAKLSVAIATVSPVSSLFHFGVNIDSQGTPVETRGLKDYGVDALPFARAVLESFRSEVLTLYEARSKVRPVN